MPKFPFLERADAAVAEIRRSMAEIQEEIHRRDSPMGSSSWDSSPQDAQDGTAPLLLARKTYNTTHPGYDPVLVRNFPGCLFNGEKPSANPALRAMRDLVQAGRSWDEELEAMFAELRTLAGSDQLFERRAVVERYFADINERHGTKYQPGWVNLDDALFIYWLLRRLKPRTVVETGVCNGFSTGLIAAALLCNGDGGELHAIGRGEIFDDCDPRWTEPGKSHGELILGGQSLGWIVPDKYRHYVHLYPGDAEALLPDTVDRLDSIDLFFHDSDHSYDHMMFEFREAYRKLSATGIIIADNIAWNSSLWDFADEYGVPAYNFRGSVGVAFFG